ncbi:hypothetical protein [Levilactobacillus fujinensis]|uniref:Uncharacterized protein n=1 Tax=Levilactobacillus fujinensis TaxID=2486024 RepID=A0ABW1TCY7_9LACO
MDAKLATEIEQYFLSLSNRTVWVISHTNHAAVAGLFDFQPNLA